MTNSQPTLMQINERSHLIADAVESGYLKLIIPSAVDGDKVLEELPPDEKAVDYIIRTSVS
jgi:hypothetical protein